MKEFVEKLIERLEEEKAKGFYDSDAVIGEKNVWSKAIEIVNQLAEEYTQTIDVAELVEKFGTDSSICSNADRIRAMSDEELAEWLAGISHEWGDGDECIVNFNGVRVGDWKTDILEWLQSEV